MKEKYIIYSTDHFGFISTNLTSPYTVLIYDALRFDTLDAANEYKALYYQYEYTVILHVVDVIP
jgi:hypothetical protein